MKPEDAHAPSELHASKSKRSENLWVSIAASISAAAAHGIAIHSMSAVQSSALEPSGDVWVYLAQ